MTIFDKYKGKAIICNNMEEYMCLARLLKAAGYTWMSLHDVTTYIAWVEDGHAPRFPIGIEISETQRKISYDYDCIRSIKYDHYYLCDLNNEEVL